MFELTFTYKMTKIQSTDLCIDFFMPINGTKKIGLEIVNKVLTFEKSFKTQVSV